MRKNSGKCIRVRARVTLVLAMFLCAINVFSSARLLRTPENGASRASLRTVADDRAEQIRHWLVKRYEDLRFAYQVETQLSELHAAEIERQRKSHAQ
jgi:hypothetical protein